MRVVCEGAEMLGEPEGKTTEAPANEKTVQAAEEKPAAGEVTEGTEATPPVQSTAAESPETESTSTETPAAESPAAESTAAESTSAELPETESASTETPAPESHAA